MVKFKKSILFLVIILLTSCSTKNDDKNTKIDVNNKTVENKKTNNDTEITENKDINITGYIKNKETREEINLSITNDEDLKFIKDFKKFFIENTKEIPNKKYKSLMHVRINLDKETSFSINDQNNLKNSKEIVININGKKDDDYKGVILKSDSELYKKVLEMYNFIEEKIK